MKVKEFEFEVQFWPPPKELQGKDLYLFGFDAEYIPYIVRWEHTSKLWCGSTLEDSLTSNASACPTYVEGRDLERRILYFAEAPAQRSALRKLAG